MDRHDALTAAAQAHGFPLDDALRVGGRYLPLLRDGPLVHISGQIPRIGERIVCIGAAGAEVTLEQAQAALKTDVDAAIRTDHVRLGDHLPRERAVASQFGEPGRRVSAQGVELGAGDR